MSLFDKYTYIVASCHKQAQEYAKAYGVPSNRFFFIGRPEQVHGVPTDTIVWLCGEYDELKDWAKIEKLLVSRGIKTLRRI